MFKEYFDRLFGYDEYVNNQLVALIQSADNKDKPAELMAHLLTAQRIWLNRCQGVVFTTYELWPKWEPQVFKDVIAKNRLDWLSFINAETDFDRIVTYKNTKGDEFNSKLVDILAHVINHGTHHRAQIGSLLKQSENIELPSTDYIFYIRSLQ